MKLLFDHNVDRRLRAHLTAHQVVTTHEMGWETLSNGLLLRRAEEETFAALLSLDKKIEHQQNLATLPLPVIVLDAPSNALPALLPFVPVLQELLGGQLDRILFVVEATGVVHRLTSPR